MKTSEDPNIPEFVTMTALGLVAETPNPSFIELDPTRRVLYCVNEIDGFEGKSSGAISAFSVDPTSGKLTLLSRRASLGARPCHLALDRTRKHLLVANGDGSVSLFPVAPDGKLGQASDVRPSTGKSAPPERQRDPRAQGVAFSPDNRFVFVCDHALDRLTIHGFDAQAGKLAPHQPAFTALKAGVGPRRLLFRPDGQFAYVSNALASTITAFAYDAKAGTLKELQTLSTVPDYFDGTNRAAELAIQPSGKSLYVSNCGHQSVVMFSVDSTNGTLTYVEDQSTYGTEPIHFGMDTPGRHLAVANRQSGSILILRAPENERVKPGGNVVEMPSAACAVFMSRPAKT
jgi:6-phosphogluconolactonase